MKTILAVFLLIGASQALVCPEQTCEGVRCEMVEDCEGRVDPNGSLCGCCPVCLKQLDYKESCLTSKLLGLPKSSECGPGLYCHPDNSSCEYDCEVRRKSGNGITNTFQRGYLGLELPKCEGDGSYSAIQCLGSMCFCVDRRGVGLNRGVNRWETEGVNCNCVRDKADHEYKFGHLLGAIWRCNVNGNYEDIQCTGSVCFCADEQGKHIEGTDKVHIFEIGSLNC